MEKLHSKQRNCSLSLKMTYKMVLIQMKNIIAPYKHMNIFLVTHIECLQKKSCPIFCHEYINSIWSYSMK